MKLYGLLTLCLLSASSHAAERQNVMDNQQYDDENAQSLDYPTPLTQPNTNEKAQKFKHNIDERGDLCNLWPEMPICGNKKGHSDDS